MRKRYWVTGVALLVFLNLPYLIALAIADPSFSFGGFLLNPVDGHSYLAKIIQGQQGSLSFRLPYSAEPNQGAPLFWFYLFLGHVSRWTGISAVLVFHAARVAASIALLAALQGFFAGLFPDRPQTAYWAFVLAVMGSGCGWVASLFGGFTADLWVAEAYPFLAMYSSPHFSLGLALLVWFAAQLEKAHTTCSLIFLFAGGLLLGSALPFGVVIAALLTFGSAVTSIGFHDRLKWQAAVAFLVPGGLLILYQFYVIRTDPVLALWDAQNLTASPPVWDVLISFSPAAGFAVYGVLKALQHRSRQLGMLAIWLVLGLALIYVPFNLQRRFMFGYMIPVAGLAAYGLSEIKSHARSLLKALSVGLALPTLLIILAGGVFAVQNSDPQVVIAKSEKAALEFLADNGNPDDLVLASPDTGLLIPAYTGQRVVYGHPFETVNATAEKLAVERFLTGRMDFDGLNWVRDRKADWIFWGPREQVYGPAPLDLPAGVSLMYENQDVKLFAIQDPE